MIKIYLLLFVFGLLGIFGYGAYWYYNDTQQRIATLRENNAQLEVAVQTANASVDVLRADVAKMGQLNNKLQKDLQKAEAYGDELRGKFSRLNLVIEALKDSAVLEGKMNGATAKLWRGFMEDTGNNIGSQSPLPEWLRGETSRNGDQNSSQGGEDNSSSSSETQTTLTN
jgi:cell division protein FtsB|tara:strand:- start:458 stop:967 length:510 start_codon:yes stop_codon:yes gene_type:complete